MPSVESCTKHSVLSMVSIYFATNFSKPMESEKRESLNFIEQMIENDLKSGKHQAIQTRFPPEPNGYLHIGHAKSIHLNFGLAQKFNGKCNLRFDDTNPEKEETEYVESIKSNVKWLGFDWHGEYYASDYFPQLYDFAKKLINKGKAYVDDLSQEEFNEIKGTPTQPGKESPYRSRTAEENLKLFEEMLDGKYQNANSNCIMVGVWVMDYFLFSNSQNFYNVVTLLF